jgi:hypothetical protein
MEERLKSPSPQKVGGPIHIQAHNSPKKIFQIEYQMRSDPGKQINQNFRGSPFQVAPPKAILKDLMMKKLLKT